MSKSAKTLAAAMSPEELAEWLGSLEPWVLDDIERDAWWWVRRPEQAPPPGNWFIWLIMSGRGWGKTRTGAEWIVESALLYPRDLDGNPTQWVVIGETLQDTRTFCIDGPSGVRQCLERRGLVEGVDWAYVKAPKPVITFTRHRQEIYFEGCDDEDTGRGYNAAGIWLDELAKWRYGEKAWLNGIMPSIRANLPGDGIPRCVVTTTPKPTALLKGWVRRARAGDPFVHLTIGSTYENFINLSANTIRELQAEYEGTSLGAQELHGALLEDADGALWTTAKIEALRVKPEDVPRLRAVVVGMDPAGTGTGDEVGLVAVGRGLNNHWYVLADWSAKMSGGPKKAAIKAWKLWAQYDANWLVAEDNLAKEWLKQVLLDAWAELADEEQQRLKDGEIEEADLQFIGYAPLKTVTAVKGKRLRAQPIAMRYEQDRAHHVGRFPELEDQMTTWVPDESPDSPDRVDALVHASAFHRDREKFSAKASSPGDVAAAAGTVQTLPRTGPYG